MMKSEIPPYKVRQSPKSKHLRLKVTREEGLCVVVPRGFDERKIPEILNRKRAWIADAVDRVGETRRFLEPASGTHLPDCVRLIAIGETWDILYHNDTTKPGLRMRAEGRTLVMAGRDINREKVILKLKDWLRMRVRAELFPLAEKIAASYRLNVHRLFVKSQRTRWASCSASRNLSLNTKLLFLPSDLLRYVLIHELCHTIHMNHTKEFWRLLQSYEPGYKLLDQQLRTAWKQVPQWMF